MSQEIGRLEKREKNGGVACQWSSQNTLNIYQLSYQHLSIKGGDNGGKKGKRLVKEHV